MMKDIRVCPECEKIADLRDMQYTKDYHGVDFRRVCYRCYKQIMNNKGYDGNPYKVTTEILDW